MKMLLIVLAATTCLLSGCAGMSTADADSATSAGPYGAYGHDNSPGPGTPASR